MAPRPQLLEGLAFYGAYHNDPWNQLIHVIFVRPPPPPPPPWAPTTGPASSAGGRGVF